MKALLVAVMAVFVAAAGPAGAQTPVLKLRADLSRPGRIALVLTGPAGASVKVTAGEREIATVRLDAKGTGRIADVARWRCDRRHREFEAKGEAPDGTALFDNAARITPGCARRFELKAKHRVRATRPLTIRVRDTFRLGAAPRRVCATASGEARVCGSVKGGRVRLRLPRAASWRLSAERAGSIRVRVRRAPGPLTVLATGDSMIQYIDYSLEDRLSGERVISDARISTGLSKPFMLNWPRHATAQVRRDKPDLTVMFIGANDGYPFGDAQCCGGDWQRAYARRVDRMMRTYARGGAAHVYWCLLPAPRDADFRRVFVAVNAAIRRAAADHRDTVTVVDLPKTFTPGFAYRPSITYEGHTVTVRQEDGIHLNPAGASIAARLIVARMRRDGVL